METKKWMKDGKPLVASARVVFTADMSTVTINPVQKEDNGEFKCQFINAVSTNEASYKMVVNCECCFFFLLFIDEALCLVHLSKLVTRLHL